MRSVRTQNKAGSSNFPATAGRRGAGDVTELAIVVVPIAIVLAIFWLYVDHQAKIHMAYDIYAWWIAGFIVALCGLIVFFARTPAIQVG